MKKITNRTELEEILYQIINPYLGTLFPGVLIACGSLKKNDHGIYAKAFGTHDGIQKNETSHLFDIASVTKAFLNVLTLKLIPFKELDQKISTVISMKGKYRDQITVKHLLTFGLEFGDVPPLSSIKDKEVLLHCIYNTDLHHPPGLSYRYTNTTSMLLTLFLEKKFGKNLQTLFKEYIFDPCGLKNITFFPQEIRTLNEIIPTEKELARGIVQDESARLFGEPNGSSGLFSTIDDLVAFGQKCFLSKKFLGEELVTKMAVSQYESHMAVTFGLGMGLRHHNECNLFENDVPIVVLKKNGFSGTHFCVFPENNFCFAIFANISFEKRATAEERDKFTNMHRKVLELLYQHRMLIL